ncbi:MAG: hypothetical protein QOI95_1116 [Acidimicrobiaceae bacterium]|jgi:predicted kinase
MTPLMIVAAGLPGAGKTSLLRWLAERTTAVLVSRDELRRALFPVCTYTEREKRVAYDVMKTGLTANIELKRSAFPDGICFTTRADLDDIVAVGRNHGAHTVVLDCQCPIDIAKDRVERDLSTLEWVPADRNADLVDRVAARFERLPDDAIVVDMTLPSADIGSQVLHHLAEHGWEPMWTG